MISKEILKEVLIEQDSRIKLMLEQGVVRREKLEEMAELTRIKQTIIIAGIRRCGKSVFLSQIIDSFFKEYYYINFEDERLANFELKDFEILYETCIELFGKKRTFFVDEIQNIDEWERWVRRMYELGFKFFITGSNAKLLSKELATKLTGRHIQVSMFPFNFREFLIFNGFELKKNDVFVPEKRAVIMKLLHQYIKTGGFPEYLKEGRIEILQGYFNDIIQRDIVERYNVTQIKQLKELARYIITNTGNLATYNQLKKTTELKSINTVIKYFSYLENAYLIFSVPYFSYSLRKQASNPFKVYAIDVGLRSALAFRFSKDIGRLYENIIAIELKQQGKEIYYWKNVQHEEVDFVIKEDIKIKQLIQVCYDVSNIKTKERETRALLKAGKELKCKNLLVITEGYESEEKLEWFGIKGTIKFIPLWKWLLQ
ncbi:MAG: ATP-binding protein [Candidatus Aenigmatarchaeota archaeon]